MKPPLGPATPTIASYSVVHSIGFSKSLACKLIVLAVEEMMRKGSMSTEELSSVQSFLKPLFYVKAVWKGSSGIADDMYHIIAGEMMGSQRPRPDVVQIAHAYSMRSKMEGVSYEACIDDWLREYNERATTTTHISELEYNVINFRPL